MSNQEINSPLLQALAQLTPAADEPTEYRWYYDAAGEIVLCSMQNHPAGKNYVVVDADVYNKYTEYQVLDQRPVKKPDPFAVTHRLRPGGTEYCTVNAHPVILLEENEIAQDTKFYETNR